MMNFKQKELIEKLTNQIKEKFPEVELIEVSESWEDPETLWIHVTEPEDEYRSLELIEFAGDRTMDIFMDYGYHMLVMQDRKKPESISEPVQRQPENRIRALPAIP